MLTELEYSETSPGLRLRPQAMRQANLSEIVAVENPGRVYNLGLTCAW